MYKLRPYAVGDGEQVRIMLRQLTDNLSGFESQKVASDKNCKAFIVESSGQVIGFGCLIISLVPTKGYVGRLEDIVIDKNYRRLGIGSLLLDKLIDTAKHDRLSMIDLTSNPARQAARRLYEKKGFFLVDTGVFRLKF